ncbi:MAG: hypothetical protein ABIS00_15860 [Gemmatimonadales bacterium]
MPRPRLPASRMMVWSSIVALLLTASARAAGAQEVTADQRAVIAVADSVLVAVSRADNATLHRLTLDSAVVGGAGVRGTSLRTWALYINRKTADFTERGFGATAMVQDRLAQVWMPYDLYVGKAWSHCGVDAFTLTKGPTGWRVASLIYTLEQPPACSKHPAGPPTP